MAAELRNRGFEHLLKAKRYPNGWCPGCGIGLIFNSMLEVMASRGLDHTNSSVISGIGCSGRMAGYVNVDSVHTLHGRALTMAESVKLVRPELSVIVASGDGDLVSIGGNHLIHTSRRNPDITVFCVNNETYGLTGGQMAPTTPLGVRTITSPAGVDHNPVSIQSLITSNRQYFFARSTVYHLDQMKDVMQQALEWPGFAFVEIISDCIEIHGRRQGFRSPYEMFLAFRDRYHLAPPGKDVLDESELGVMKKG